MPDLRELVDPVTPSVIGGHAHSLAWRHVTPTYFVLIGCSHKKLVRELQLMRCQLSNFITRVQNDFASSVQLYLCGLNEALSTSLTKYASLSCCRWTRATRCVMHVELYTRRTLGVINWRRSSVELSRQHSPPRTRRDNNFKSRAWDKVI